MQWKRLLTNKINILCLAVMLGLVLYDFIECYMLSDELKSNKSVSRRLKQGWVPGRPQRDDIGQYESFRQSKSFLLGLIFFQLAVSHLCTLTARYFTDDPLRIRRVRMITNGILAFIVLIALHGVNMIWIVTIALVQYTVVLLLVKRSRVVSIAYVWVSVLLIFYFMCSDISSNYFDLLFLKCWVKPACSTSSLSKILQWLRNHQGVASGWADVYRLSFLRMVSFQMDFIWYHHAVVFKEEVDPQFYSFANYWAYINYIPLYLAGPLTTFNDFTTRWTMKRAPDYRQIFSVRHVVESLKSSWWTRYFKSLVVWLIFIVIYDVSSHYMYLWVIYSRLQWEKFITGVQATALTYMLSYWYFWGKYYVILQFGKMWAMLDCNHGQCVADEEKMVIPDDLPFPIIRSCSMLRFMLDNWHVSFIQFAMRYIYVPLGGLPRLYLSGVGILLFSSWVHGVNMLWTVRGFLAQGLPLIAECLFRFAILKWRFFAERTYIMFAGLVLISATAVTTQGWPAEVLARKILVADFFKSPNGAIAAILVLVFFAAKNYVVFDLEQSGDKDTQQQQVLTSEERAIELMHLDPQEHNITERALTLHKVAIYQSTYHPCITQEFDEGMIEISLDEPDTQQQIQD